MPGKLTDATLRAIKGNGKTQKISDGHGLYIHVSPTGSRLWRMAYYFDGKQKLLSFGQYPEAGLAQARKLCLEAKESLAKGLDPAAEKKRLKLEAERAAEIASRTFLAVAQDWLDFQKDAWAYSNYKKKKRLIDIPATRIGAIPISRLIPADILSVIRPIEACGKNVTSHALAQTANQICRYARACGDCTFNAADGLTGF